VLQAANRSALIATGVILACCVGSVIADESSRPTRGSLAEVIVRGKRIPERVPDEELTRRVEVALQSNPYLYLEHVTIRTINGVVHLEGSVSEDSDLLDVLRYARKVPGVRRIVNELDLDSPGGS
jgi:hypothetical protein